MARNATLIAGIAGGLLVVVLVTRHPPGTAAAEPGAFVLGHPVHIDGMARQSRAAIMAAVRSSAPPAGADSANMPQDPARRLATARQGLLTGLRPGIAVAQPGPAAWQGSPFAAAHDDAARQPPPPMDPRVIGTPFDMAHQQANQKANQISPNVIGTPFEQAHQAAALPQS